MDKETWQFINSFAPWFSALGSISAVIVALYLATQDRRARLKISSSVQILVQGNQSAEFIGVKAVNIGRRDVTVTGIGWRFGIWKKRHFSQLGFSPHSAPLPKKLVDGETAMYLVALEKNSHWVSGMQKNLGSAPWVQVYFMRAEVATSLGKTFRVRVDRSIRDLLTGKGVEQV